MVSGVARSPTMPCYRVAGQGLHQNKGDKRDAEKGGDEKQDSF